ncbi:hypothetical protein [Homoserinimonas sp. OAct 916]|uniref:hypothetical protein n=1 Tax=Homoserinimonas sp. OAct 916 TaxID=2211450 RepID=UPI001300B343|nr:hypothetical protein [Homoserinimonas sp. OAct 916]
MEYMPFVCTDSTAPAWDRNHATTEWANNPDEASELPAKPPMGLHGQIEIRTMEPIE